MSLLQDYLDPAHLLAGAECSIPICSCHRGFSGRIWFLGWDAGRWQVDELMDILERHSSLSRAKEWSPTFNYFIGQGILNWEIFKELFSPSLVTWHWIWLYSLAGLAGAGGRGCDINYPQIDRKSLEVRAISWFERSAVRPRRFWREIFQCKINCFAVQWMPWEMLPAVCNWELFQQIGRHNWCTVERRIWACSGN